MPEENQASSPPGDRAPRPDFLSATKFEDFDLPTEVLAGLEEAGFIYCTPIQAQALPVNLAGRDVAGQAQTGTGKTAAFLVATFTRLMRRPSKKAGLPGALIVAPTRELALQVNDDALILGKYTGLTTAVAVGGIDYREQADEIRKGPDIVICTPGRLIDYLKQGIFKTTGIEVLVVDEADRLFDLGFIKDLRFLLKKLPHFDRRQTMLFSATLSHRVLELTYEFMNMPEFISVIPEDVAVEGVEQSLYHVGQGEKFALLLGLLEREEWTRILIFANTKASVEWLAAKLQANGYPAEGITGDLPQLKRIKLMERFKDNRLKILVATDVASRGIHVEDISHVFNYDLPQDAENYVHRIGRTARAGKKGRAISFACEEYVFHLEPLEKLLGYQIPTVWYEDDWLKEDAAPEIRVRRSWRARPSDGRDRAPRRGTKPFEGRDRDRERDYDRDRERDHDRDRDRRGPRPPERKIKPVSRPGGIYGLRPGYKDEMVRAAALEAEARARGEEQETVIPAWAMELNEDYDASEEIRAEIQDWDEDVSEVEVATPRAPSAGPEPATGAETPLGTEPSTEDKPKKKRRRPRRKKKPSLNGAERPEGLVQDGQIAAAPELASQGGSDALPAPPEPLGPEAPGVGEPAAGEEPRKRKRRPRRRKKPGGGIQVAAEGPRPGEAYPDEPSNLRVDSEAIPQVSLSPDAGPGPSPEKVETEPSPADPEQAFEPAPEVSPVPERIEPVAAPAPPEVVSTPEPSLPIAEAAVPERVIDAVAAPQDEPSTATGVAPAREVAPSPSEEAPKKKKASPRRKTMSAPEAEVPALEDVPAKAPAEETPVQGEAPAKTEPAPAKAPRTTKAKPKAAEPEVVPEETPAEPPKKAPAKAARTTKAKAKLAAPEVVPEVIPAEPPKKAPAKAARTTKAKPKAAEPEVVPEETPVEPPKKTAAKAARTTKAKPKPAEPEVVPEVIPAEPPKKTAAKAPRTTKAKPKAAEPEVVPEETPAEPPKKTAAKAPRTTKAKPKPAAPETPVDEKPAKPKKKE
ncbi:MAG: DEAD/DEAH box helicase [Pseudomonadota bacterium]